MATEQRRKKKIAVALAWNRAHSKRHNQHTAAWRHAHPDQQARLCKAWAKKNSEKIRDASRKRRQKNLLACRAYDKEYQFKKRYGISLTEKQFLFDAQQGRCANAKCGRKFQTLGKAHLDHNHTTRKNRGLLCQQCNLALGLVHENIDILDGLGSYLRRYL